jgi:plasmid stabilization system protein ParE
MIYKVFFKQETLVDITEIANWYNEKRNGLGNEFLEELELSIKIIKANPYKYQIQKKEIRQAILNRFPYLIMFEIEEGEIIIYSVLHSKRNPKDKFIK